MKVFTDKNIIKKIALILVLITIFIFAIPGVVRANAVETIGGKLLSPIMSLFVSLGDATMSIIQKVVYDMDDALINLNTSKSIWAKIIVIGVAILAVVGTIAITILTAGAAAGVMAAVVAVAKGVVSVITIIGVAVITYPVTTSLVEGMLPRRFLFTVIFSISGKYFFE